MYKSGLTLAAAAIAVGLALASPAGAQEKKVFYLLSHGGPSDAFWIDWNAGATKACEQLNVTCKISFSGGDMASQKEAFNSAIASKPGHVVVLVSTSSPALVVVSRSADVAVSARQLP